MKKLLFFSTIILIAFGNLNAQLRISYYNNESAAFDYSFAKLNETSHLLMELRTSMDTDFEEITNWVNMLYKIQKHDAHSLSVGAGMRFDPFYEGGDGAAIVLPFQLELYPLKEIKQLSLIFELIPEIYMDEKYLLRSNIGFRYAFNKKE